MRSKGAFSSPSKLQEAIRVARGECKADLVIKNGRFLDVFNGEFCEGDLALQGSSIVGIGNEYEGERYLDASKGFLVPGFIDTHVHIESSLMTPRHFCAAVLPLGTTTALWDPHEIANVKGRAGIAWALAACEGLPLDILVMIPSCVPSTAPQRNLESGACRLEVDDLALFKDHPRVLGLAEMMDYPGLLAGDPSILAKLLCFGSRKRDGHSPGLSGKDLNAYAVTGIHSCHEVRELGEAREKLQRGLHVLIREGSCAKDARRLLPLVNAYTSAVLGFCSDDRNPVDIHTGGHINGIIEQGLALGKRPEDLFRIASFSAARAYGLEDRGVLAPGYLGDVVLVVPHRADDWREGFSVRAVIKAGQLVDRASLLLRADEQEATFHQRYFRVGDNLAIPDFTKEDFVVAPPELPKHGEEAPVKVIGVIHEQIVTAQLELVMPINQGEILADPSRDILKIAVIERHRNTGFKSTALVRGFGLQEGAIASTIAHDCHNLIVVGVDGQAMAEAVNYLKRIDGGIVVWKSSRHHDHLALPIGGLMSTEPPEVIAARLTSLINLTKSMGCSLEQPFLLLSFLALPVVGKLKLTDRGLVDVDAGKVVSLLCAKGSIANQSDGLYS